MQPAETPQTAVRARLEIRARRIAKIRRRVAASVLATFALAFGAIFETGSPTATLSPAAASVASSAPVSAPATAATAGASNASTAATTQTSKSATVPAAVTTSQS